MTFATGARVGAAALLLYVCPSTAHTQSPAEESREFVVKIGPAVEYDTRTRETGYGAAAAAETGILGDRLAAELGVSVIAADAMIELGAVLLLKKPFELSDRAELMLTAGPSLSRGGGETAAGAVLGADLMLWPRPALGRPALGWYVETGYGTDFRRAGERSIGLSAGILLRFR
jgi:hypothetical protein